MKARILEILRTETGVVSGARLSSDLNISRVSVWKHIRKLQEQGYSIEATPKGYSLQNSPDALFAWEFPERQDTIHYLEQTDSTMAIARDLARKGKPEYTVVVAGRQLKGRGRLNRQWHSAEGGLYFTVILRPQLPPVLSGRVNFAAAMSLVDTLAQLFQIEARVKWPNDVLVGERKIAGMLSELEADSDQVIYVNLGLGINVNNDIDPFKQTATSLRKILGHAVARKEVLACFLERLEERMQPSQLEKIVDEWKQHTITLDRRVRIVTRQVITEGFAIDIDPNGALILALDDGETTTVHYGDCFHQ